MGGSTVKRMCGLGALGAGAVAAAVALGGCGVSSTIDPVAKAAEVSEAQAGFKARFTETISAPGSSEQIVSSGSETYDARDRRGALSLQEKLPDGSSSKTEAVASNYAVYTRLPGDERSSVAEGKEWIEIDTAKAAGAMGINVSALSSSASSSSPSTTLAYLKGVDPKIKDLGTAKVGGVTTTHYHARVDYRRYLWKVPADQRAAATASVGALERLTGSSTLPVDVWVDGAERVRRMEYDMSECLSEAGGMPVHLHLSLRMELSDFGPQQEPSLPASGNVDDITASLQEELKHVKLGCA